MPSGGEEEEQEEEEEDKDKEKKKKEAPKKDHEVQRGVSNNIMTILWPKQTPKPTGKNPGLDLL